MLHHDRLPPISNENIGLTVMLQSMRSHLGLRWCKRHGVGEMRRTLGPAPDTIDLELLPMVEIERDRSRNLLAGMCHACPYSRCEMKRWPTD